MRYYIRYVYDNGLKLREAKILRRVAEGEKIAAAKNPAALRKLERLGYIENAADRWYATEEGERVLARISGEEA